MLWTFLIDHKKGILRANEKVQWVKMFAAKPDDVSAILRIHIVEGEN